MKTFSIAVLTIKTFNYGNYNLIQYDRQKSGANIYNLSEPINYSDCQFPSQFIQNDVYFSSTYYRNMRNNRHGVLLTRHWFNLRMYIYHLYCLIFHY